MCVFVCVQMKCEIMEHVGVQMKCESMEHDGYEGEGLDEEEEYCVTEGHRPFPFQVTHIGSGQIHMNSNEGLSFSEDGASDEYVQVRVCVYAVGFRV